MKKEVIIVLHTLAVGGAERRLSTVANYMVSKGISVTMLLLDNPVVKFELNPQVKIVCVNQNPDLTEYDPTKCDLYKVSEKIEISFSDKLKLLLTKVFNKAKNEYLNSEIYLKCRNVIPIYEYIKNYPDATVISFMTMPNISLMMAMQKLPNRALFAECIDVQSEYPPESPYNLMRKKYFPRANAAIFQTPDEKDYYSFLPDVKKYVIPNFIKGEIFPKRYDGERRKDIVNFCRLSAAKDLPLLIEAYDVLHDEYPEYTLSIYGEGLLKDELLKLIKDKGLTDCAHIYDFDLKIHDKVRDAAMFVSSSYREGISNSMLEALAIGMPCVCTDCAGGGARMMIEDHENGLLVPMRDAKALYLGMKELIDNPELSEKISKNAVKIKERLKPETICNQMIEAILGEKI